MEGNYKIAHVRFLDGNNKDKTYKYACYDDELRDGDICVVATEHHGFAVAQIVSITPKTEEKLTREIVCYANFSAYNNRIAERARAAELRKKMADRAAQLQEVALYQMLADKDPTMKELLTEYGALTYGHSDS